MGAASHSECWLRTASSTETLQSMRVSSRRQIRGDKEITIGPVWELVDDHGRQSETMVDVERSTGSSHPSRPRPADASNSHPLHLPIGMAKDSSTTSSSAKPPSSSSSTAKDQTTAYAPTLHQLIHASSELYAANGPSSPSKNPQLKDFRGMLSLLSESGKHDAVMGGMVEEGKNQTDPLAYFDVSKESLLGLYVL